MNIDGVLHLTLLTFACDNNSCLFFSLSPQHQAAVLFHCDDNSVVELFTDFKTCLKSHWKVDDWAHWLCKVKLVLFGEARYGRFGRLVALWSSDYAPTRFCSHHSVLRSGVFVPRRRRCLPGRVGTSCLLVNASPSKSVPVCSVNWHFLNGVLYLIASWFN